MNKRWVLGLATLSLLTACGGATDLAVRAVSEGEGEEVRGRAQLVIRMLPYDRDSIFDALTTEASEPEPEPPADLLALRDSAAAAQVQWRDAEATWNELRSELQDLSERMEGMDRSSNEYFEAYQRFDDAEAQLNRLDRVKQNYFDTFTRVDSLYRARADSFSAVHTSWGDAAFERYGEIVDSILEVQGREELWDTTDASGWAYFRVPRGQWWIYTRAPLPFEELYWNVPYESTGGADTLMLDGSNAQIRSRF